MVAEPLVSCVMIFLNAEQYIEEAIQSVLAQNYAQWELLLVDDGSTDGSTAIAARYARDFPGQIVYLEHAHHQNLGMSASRNVGIRHARGEFIAFLDADDLWLPSKLREQVSIMQREPHAGMIYGRSLIWHSWTGEPDDQQRDHFLSLGVKPDQLVEPPTLFYWMLENKVQTPMTCNAMMRRSVVEAVGGFEESFRAMYEDQAFFAKLQLSVPIYVASAHWANYRQHPQSCSALADESQSYEATRRPYLNWLLDYVAVMGPGRKSEVWRALQREQWLCAHPAMRRVLNFPKMAAWRLRSSLRPLRVGV